MKFKNATNEIKKFRVDSPGTYIGYAWITLRPGDFLELPEEVGKKNKLTIVDNKEEKKTEKVEIVIEPVEKKKIPKKKSSKKKENILYKEKLESIKGIGKKTAKDIITMYSTEESLKKDLKTGCIPVRDDVERLLKKQFR